MWPVSRRAFAELGDFTHSVETPISERSAAERRLGLDTTDKHSIETSHSDQSVVELRLSLDTAEKQIEVVTRKLKFERSSEQKALQKA